MHRNNSTGKTLLQFETEVDHFVHIDPLLVSQLNLPFDDESILLNSILDDGVAVHENTQLMSETADQSKPRCDSSTVDDESEHDELESFIMRPRRNGYQHKRFSYLKTNRFGSYSHHGPAFAGLSKKNKYFFSNTAQHNTIRNRKTARSLVHFEYCSFFLLLSTFVTCQLLRCVIFIHLFFLL